MTKKEKTQKRDKKNEGRGLRFDQKKRGLREKKRGNKRGTQEKELGDVGTRHFLLLHDIVGETKK